MPNKYQTIAHRSDLAIYYGWEYGIRYARELLKEAKEVRPGFYKVRPLCEYGRKTKTRYYNQGLADRVREIVAAHRGRMTKKLGGAINIYVENY